MKYVVLPWFGRSRIRGLEVKTQTLLKVTTFFPQPRSQGSFQCWPDWKACGIIQPLHYPSFNESAPESSFDESDGWSSNNQSNIYKVMFSRFSPYKLILLGSTIDLRVK